MKDSQASHVHKQTHSKSDTPHTDNHDDLGETWSWVSFLYIIGERELLRCVWNLKSGPTSQDQELTEDRKDVMHRLSPVRERVVRKWKRGRLVWEKREDTDIFFQNMIFPCEILFDNVHLHVHVNYRRGIGRVGTISQNLRIKMKWIYYILRCFGTLEVDKSWKGQQSQQGSPDTSTISSGKTLSSRHPWDKISPGFPGRPGVSSGMGKHQTSPQMDVWETTKPPQLAPLNKEEQRFYSEFLGHQPELVTIGERWNLGWPVNRKLCLPAQLSLYHKAPL